LALNQKEIIIVDAPLREVLTINSSNMIFISDEILNIFFYFRYFHEFEIIRAIYTEILRNEIIKIEGELSWYWVLEACSWYLTDLYRDNFHEKTNKPLDARNILLLRIFSFLPAVQEALYAPQFPFTYAYFNNIYFIDPFRTNIIDYKRDVPPGRVITERLKDVLSRDSYNKLFLEYIQKYNLRFVDVANKYLKENETWFWKNVLRKLPCQNYLINKIEKKKINKKWKNIVKIKRETQEEVIEPVKLYAKEWFGKKYYLDWDGKGNEHEFIFGTEKKLRVIEIDPDKRLHEMYLFDNRVPSKYVLIVQEINASLGISDTDFEANIDLQVRRMYNPKNFYNFSGFLRPSGYGFQAGYGRQFGKLLDFLRLYHNADVSFFFQKLDENFVDVTESVSVPVDSGITTSIIFGYWFGNFFSYKNPQGGWSVSFFTELSSPIILSDYKFYRTGINITKLTEIFYDHILAIRAGLGTSGIDNVPEQREFSLGGVYNIKGLPQSDADFVGKHRFLANLEYRHPIFRNLNINFFDLFRIRKIKGSIFTDAGRVTSTVQEKRLIQASLIDNYETTLADTFDVRKYSSDFGYSLQIFFDALGIRETLLRFDVAKRIDNFKEELTPRFYISLDQSF
jgi:hypothetical protein